MANITVTQIDNTITANSTTDIIQVSETTTNVIVASTTITEQINLSNVTVPIESNSNISTDANITADYINANTAFVGDLIGDVYAGDGTSKILENGTNGSDASFTGDVTGDVTGTVSSLANHNTGGLTEGLNLYYTTDRANTAIGSYTGNIDNQPGTIATAQLDANIVQATLGFGGPEVGPKPGNGTFTVRGGTSPGTILLDSSGITIDSGDALPLSLEGLEVDVEKALFANNINSRNELTINTGPNKNDDDAYIYASRTGLTDAYIKWNETTDVWEVFDGTNTNPIGAGVTSVNGQTGVVVLDTDDISQGTTNLYYANSLVDNWLQNNDVQIGGNLNVTGTIDGTFSISNTTSSEFQINAGATFLGADGVFSVFRFGTQNAVLEWDEAADRWKHGTQGNELFIPITTDDLSEGNANLYYTDARSRAAVSASGDLDYNASTGVFSVTTYKTADFNTDFATKDTDDLTEGTTNKYYSTTLFNADFATKTTTDLTEGANLYYTTDRANSAISAYTGSMENLTGNITTTANIQAEYVIANNEFLGDLDGAISTAVFNNTATTLTKGKAVYLTGGNQGDQPHVDLADNTNASQMPALGIVKENIGAGSEGQVVTSGVINFSSHGFTQGADLYVNGSGDLTTTIPTGESELIQKIGKVVSPNHIIVQGAFRTNATPNLDEGNIFLGSTSNTAIAVAPDSNFDTTGNTFSLSNALSDVNKIDSETDTALTLFGEAGIELNQKVDSTESRVVDLTTDGYRVAFADAGNANVASYTGGVKQLLVGATVTAGSAVVSCFPLQFLGTGYPAGIYVAGQSGASAYLDLTAGFTYQSVQACLANAAVCGGVQNGAGWKIYNGGVGSFVSQFTGNAYVQSVTGNNITMSETAHTSGTTAYILFPGAHSSNNNTPFIMKSTAESSGYTTFNFDGLRPFGMYFDNPETLANATMDYVSVSDNFDLANVQMQQRADINAGNDSALRTNRLLLIGESANPDFVSSPANASVPSETSALGVTVEHDGLTDWQSANTTPVTKFLINTFQGNTLQDGNVLPTWAEPFSSGVHDKDMEYVSAPSFNFKIANNNKDSSLADQRMTGDVIVGKLSWNYLSNAAPVYNMGTDALTSPASILAKIPSSHTNTSRIADLDMYLQSTYATSYRNGANVDAGSIPRTFLASQSGNTVISAKTDGKIMLKPVRDYGDDGSTGNASYSLNRYSDELHDYHTFLSAEFANTSAKTGTIVTIQDASGSTNGDTNGFNYDSKGNATLRLQTHLANSDPRYNFDIIHDESTENLVIASDPSANTEHVRIESSGRVNIKQVMKLHPLSNSAILALTGNEVGDMVYGSDANRVCYYDGTNWVTIDTNTAIV